MKIAKPFNFKSKLSALVAFSVLGLTMHTVQSTNIDAPAFQPIAPNTDAPAFHPIAPNMDAPSSQPVVQNIVEHPFRRNNEKIWPVDPIFYGAIVDPHQKSDEITEDSENASTHDDRISYENDLNHLLESDNLD